MFKWLSLMSGFSPPPPTPLLIIIFAYMLYLCDFPFDSLGCQSSGLCNFIIFALEGNGFYVSSLHCHVVIFVLKRWFYALSIISFIIMLLFIYRLFKDQISMHFAALNWNYCSTRLVRHQLIICKFAKFNSEIPTYYPPCQKSERTI